MTDNQEKITNNTVQYIINVLSRQGLDFSYDDLYRGYISVAGTNRMTAEGFRVAYEETFEILESLLPNPDDTAAENEEHQGNLDGVTIFYK